MMTALLLAEVLDIAAQAAPAVGLGLPMGAYIIWRERLEARRQAFLEKSEIRIVDETSKPDESRASIERQGAERALEKVWRNDTSSTLAKVIEDGDKSRKLTHEVIDILKRISDGIASLNDKIEGLGK